MSQTPNQHTFTCPENTACSFLTVMSYGHSLPVCQIRWASQVALVVKNPPANAGGIRDVGSIPGSGRSPLGGHGNPLQYSCLENPMDRGAWRATWGHKSQNDLETKPPPQRQNHMNLGEHMTKTFYNCLQTQ